MLDIELVKGQCTRTWTVYYDANCYRRPFTLKIKANIPCINESSTFK